MQCPVCGGDGVMWVDNRGKLGYHFKHADSCPLPNQTPPRLASFLEGLCTGDERAPGRMRGFDRVRPSVSY